LTGAANSAVSMDQQGHVLTLTINGPETRNAAN
jgi:enoyl-CoA hydratase/carnithine racemase